MVTLRNRLRVSIIAVVLLVCVACEKHQQATVVEQIAWGPGQKWMVGDFHSHTKFSDGNLDVEEIAKLAAMEGCDILAITDHSDRGEQAASPDYFDKIELARAAIPRLLILGGLEWNVPPYGGREHMNVLLHPEDERLLIEFKDQFEQDQSTSSSVSAALGWLETRATKAGHLVAIYNHPSRKAESLKARYADLLKWRSESNIPIAFEGAPGHMNDLNLGSYRAKYKTVDHWDRLAADVPGVWDVLLQSGENISAALASSDYHNKRLDKSPCQFSRTHLLVPERSYEGVLQALRAGSFWASHGNFVNHLDFSVMADGLLIPAIPGEKIIVPKSQVLTVRLALKRAQPFDQDKLELELIGDVINGKTEFIGRGSLAAGETEFTWQISPESNSRTNAYVRLRITKFRDNLPDFMAYTNAIRFEFL